MHATHHLTLKFDVLKNEKLIVQIENKFKSSNKHVFETSISVSYANKEKRRSNKNYVFKLFVKLIN